MLITFMLLLRITSMKNIIKSVYLDFKMPWNTEYATPGFILQ